MTCEIHTYHRPAVQGPGERHHVVPLAWTRLLGAPEGRTVRVCPTGHNNLHRDLRDAIRGLPYRAGAESRVLVQEAQEFYEAHPEAHEQLWTIARELVEEAA